MDIRDMKIMYPETSPPGLMDAILQWIRPVPQQVPVFWPMLCSLVAGILAVLVYMTAILRDIRQQCASGQAPLKRPSTAPSGRACRHNTSLKLAQLETPDSRRLGMTAAIKQTTRESTAGKSPAFLPFLGQQRRPPFTHAGTRGSWGPRSGARLRFIADNLRSRVSTRKPIFVLCVRGQRFPVNRTSYPTACNTKVYG
ncbi:uncharacterized protein [Dermacentor albipictus]|uniref:uncharacterized protein isoform X2 n=1 Tax=Dermacentor albipictus TaxID=60249 RepID=UPI0038FD124B